MAEKSAGNEEAFAISERWSIRNTEACTVPACGNKRKKTVDRKMGFIHKVQRKTGKEHIRGEKIPEGFYHMTVHVWIRNYKGEYLISRRSANRKLWLTDRGTFSSA